VTTPAILGGAPAVPTALPFARPAAPPLEKVVKRFTPSYEAGRLTNGPLVAELEAAVAEQQGVTHAVAVSSCTTGLILVLQAIAPDGPVIVPSFTFSASAHAIVWNGLQPMFAECDPDSFQLDVADARERAAGSAGAVLATHVFGAPCPADLVEALGRVRGVRVVFDAAHALGARLGGQAVANYGAAEVFSLSPTKPVVAGEGGLVLTNDPAIAEHVRVGRDYGNPGDYDTRFVGLNARMSEFHAATALESLEVMEANLRRRHEQVAVYQKLLGEVPGLRFQHVPAEDVSTYKDLTVSIGADFGLDRDGLVTALLAEGIETRCYFSPPVHHQTAYRGWIGAELPVTEAVARSVVSLLVFAQLTDTDVEAIADAVARVQAHGEEIARGLADEGG
jgi:dTDP-4-amino-4,6-dideoxygalactose transaminase